MNFDVDNDYLQDNDRVLKKSHIYYRYVVVIVRLVIGPCQRSSFVETFVFILLIVCVRPNRFTNYNVTHNIIV